MASATAEPLQANNILVFGATGLIGSRILQALIQAKDKFNRIAIFTSPSTLANKKDLISSVQSEGVEIIIGDIKNEDDVITAYQGIDTVISALGRDLLASQIPLIQLADRTPSVKWFFPSEYGTDIEYGPSSAHEKPHQQKLKVRAALRDARDLAYTYVVTGPFADLYVAPTGPGGEGSGGFDVKGKRANLLGSEGKGRISLTTMADVGKLVLASLSHPSQSRNRALKVNSFTTTPADILSEYERQTGGEKWSVTYTPLEELRELEDQAWASSSPTATVFTLRRIWTEGGTLYDRRDNADIGEPETESLRDVVVQAIKKQSAQV